MPSSNSTWKLQLILQDPAQMSPSLVRLTYPEEGSSGSAWTVEALPYIWRPLHTRRGSLMNLLWHPEQGLAHSRLSLNVCWRMCSHQNEYMRFPEEINTFQFLSSLPCWFQCGRQIHLWVLVSFFSSTLRADGTLSGALHGYHTHWLRVKA